MFAALMEHASRVTGMGRSERKQPAEPELLVRKPRPMTGLLSQLTPEQLERAFAFTGDVNSGRSDGPGRQLRKNC